MNKMNGEPLEHRKVRKMTVGKQIVKPFYCPQCQEQCGEQQIGKDVYCGKNQYKVTTLCYKCGFNSTTIMNGKPK